MFEKVPVKRLDNKSSKMKVQTLSVGVQKAQMQICNPSE